MSKKAKTFVSRKAAKKAVRSVLRGYVRAPMADELVRQCNQALDDLPTQEAMTLDLDDPRYKAAIEALALRISAAHKTPDHEKSRKQAREAACVFLLSLASADPPVVLGEERL